MDRIITFVFFAAGLVAYGLFFADRAQAFGVHDYSTDVIAIPLLGILAHLAFQRRVGETG